MHYLIASMTFNQMASFIDYLNGNYITYQVKKKVKVNKRELPENNAFYCDRCDRGFKTSDKLQEHVDQHVKVTHYICTIHIRLESSWYNSGFVSSKHASVMAI
jgi:hypothetical protein